MKTKLVDSLFLASVVLAPVLFILAPFVAKHSINSSVCMLIASALFVAVICVYNHFDK